LQKIVGHPWPTIGKNDATVNYFFPARPGDLAQQTSQACLLHEITKWLYGDVKIFLKNYTGCAHCVRSTIAFL
jgi:hypothetical protein